MHWANFRPSIDVNTITERGSAAACDKFNVIAAPHLQTEAVGYSPQQKKKNIYQRVIIEISIIKRDFDRDVNVVLA